MLDGFGTIEVWLELKLTVRPPAGAGLDNVTAKLVERPKPTEGLPSVKPPRTVTLAVALVKPVWLAVMVTGPPGATPVTATLAVVAFAANVTVAGTVAIAVLLEARLTTKPPVGASPPVKLRTKLPEPPVTLRVDGEKAIAGAPTVTVPVPDVQLVAEAVMMAEPTLWP